MFKPDLEDPGICVQCDLPLKNYVFNPYKKKRTHLVNYSYGCVCVNPECPNFALQCASLDTLEALGIR